MHIIDVSLQNITQFLHKNETVLMTLRQSYLSSISPDSVAVTDKRVIIIHNSFWGLYFGHNFISPTRVSSVMLNNIMGTTNSNGKILATVQIRIRGSGEDEMSEGSGWHIAGLRIKEAQTLSDIIEESIDVNKERLPELDLDATKSLLKDGKSSIIWLGPEPTNFVSYLLGIDSSYITRMNPVDITSMSQEGLSKLGGKIFICYNGNVSAQIVSLLKDEYGVKAFLLGEGLMGIIKKSGKDKNNNMYKQ